MIQILVVDDHESLRKGLGRVFDGRVDMEIAAEAATGAQAEALLHSRAFDVALVDLTLPDMSGMEVLARAQAICPQMAVLIVSACPEDQYAVNVLKAGAAGFVPKDSPAENFITAVIAAADGRRYVSARIADKLAVGLRGPSASEPAHSHLSEREFQIFCRLAVGETVTVIAKDLGLSVKTVSTYRSRILEKMNFASNANITYYAMKNQLIA